MMDKVRCEIGIERNCLFGTYRAPATKTPFISSRYNHSSKRSSSLLSSYWGSAGAGAQSCESRNCMKDRVLNSGCSGVTFGNCGQRACTPAWSLSPIYENFRLPVAVQKDPFGPY